MKTRTLFPLAPLLALCTPLAADDEAANRPVVRSSEYGGVYARSVPDENYGQKGKTRVYRVGPQFWAALKPVAIEGIDPPPMDSDGELSRLIEDFCANGFPWPEGAFATLNQESSTVTLRNTADTLREMERWLGPMDGSGVF